MRNYSRGCDKTLILSIVTISSNRDKLPWHSHCAGENLFLAFFAIIDKLPILQKAFVPRERCSCSEYNKRAPFRYLKRPRVPFALTRGRQTRIGTRRQSARMRLQRVSASNRPPNLPTHQR